MTKGVRIKFVGKISGLAVIILFIVLVSASHAFRKKISLFFSPRCIATRQAQFSNRLNDKLAAYGAGAKAKGIKECRNEKEIMKLVRSGSLKKIVSNRYYLTDRLQHSYPYLTGESKLLLKEIGRRFRQKTRKAGYIRARFIITSMTRTTESLNSLMDDNSNTSASSPHLYGNAFDISWSRFSCIKLFKTDCDNYYLKEALAEVIFELRRENRCRVVYERKQSCYHVVAW